MRIVEVDVELEVNDGLSRRWHYRMWAECDDGDAEADVQKAIAKMRVMLSNAETYDTGDIRGIPPVRIGASELPDVNPRPWEARDE